MMGSNRKGQDEGGFSSGNLFRAKVNNKGAGRQGDGERRAEQGVGYSKSFKPNASRKGGAVLEANERGKSETGRGSTLQRGATQHKKT